MAIATSGLLWELLGSRADGASPPASASSPSVWTPAVAIGSETGTLTNFEGTSTSGWDGTGIESDPYALVFDGTDTVVNFGDVNGLELTDAITVEYWMYCTGGHQYGRIIRKRDTGGGWSLYNDTTNNQVRFSATYATSGSVDQLYTPGITILNNWHHVVFTWDTTAGELWCYVNGGSTYASGYSGVTYKTGAISADQSDVVMGNNPTDTTRPYGGAIPTVRIYNRAITEAEAYANFLEGKIGESGLAAGEPPTVLTSAISNITANTASGGGIITDEGDSALTAYGVCWNTSGTPTIADDYTDDS